MSPLWPARGSPTGVTFPSRNRTASLWAYFTVTGLGATTVFKTGGASSRNSLLLGCAVQRCEQSMSLPHSPLFSAHAAAYDLPTSTPTHTTSAIDAKNTPSATHGRSKLDE